MPLLRQTPYSSERDVTTALIIGVSGQDGAYLAKFLLTNGYEVFGAHRRSSTLNLWRLDELGIREHPKLKLVVHDLTDATSCIRVLEAARPREVYNLGAQSFVAASFDQPRTTTEITGVGALNVLEAIRIVDRGIRFYQASSAEMYGLVQQVPQTEQTPFYPRSPYAIAKLYAHWMAINYRESYGLFASCGILFNHESPLRGADFVTRKISDGVAGFALGEPGPIYLGNLNAQRDWGYAPEYVAGMWQMLQMSEPDTFVFATNQTNSVRSFVEWAFEAVNVGIEWVGQGSDEKGVCRETGRVLVEVSPEFYRPAEVDTLIGDASKAERIMGWRPETPVRDVCAKMVAADIQRRYQRRASPDLRVRIDEPRGVVYPANMPLMTMLS
jgi:GDPmannose 4,6-dehydratase